jgi:anthranilate synthase component 2
MHAAMKVNAETADRLVMGLKHDTHPVHGVQFHPESIASEHGHLMLKNFLDVAAAWNAKRGQIPVSARKSADMRARA